MAKLQKEARYVYTDIGNNNNKFWNILLFEDGACETKWGRVGEQGQSKRFDGYNVDQFESKCREKQGKGYRPQKTVGNPASAFSVQSENLAELAKNQIKSNSPETLALVGWLAKVNIHDILQATSLQYDESRGTFSTPLGIVTEDGIAEARTLLSHISSYVHQNDYDHPDFIKILNDYLMLIPQNIGRAKPDPRRLYPDVEAVQAQRNILDSLATSLQLALIPTEEAETAPLLFEAKLNLVKERSVIERISKKYRSTLQLRHLCSHLEVKSVFSVEIASMTRAFEAEGRRIGNVQELWHGTKAFNLLSILKSGFHIPSANAGYVTGRLFGNGIYFSDQSTKSLNYAYGYWDGKATDRCFMFLNDVAMGRSYMPQTFNEDLPKLGYDSAFAKGGTGSLLNNEMIVYKTFQINPRFLVEFSIGGK